MYARTNTRERQELSHGKTNRAGILAPIIIITVFGKVGSVGAVVQVEDNHVFDRWRMIRIAVDVIWNFKPVRVLVLVSQPFEVCSLYGSQATRAILSGKTIQETRMCAGTVLRVSLLNKWFHIYRSNVVGKCPKNFPFYGPIWNHYGAGICACFGRCNVSLSLIHRHYVADFARLISFRPTNCPRVSEDVTSSDRLKTRFTFSWGWFSIFLYRITVHGGWSRWSGWNSCSKTCGAGSQERSRSCTNPRPRYGGNSCRGAALDKQTCNKQLCPGKKYNV